MILRAQLLLLTIWLCACGAVVQPLRWSADTRELVIAGRSVSVTAPSTWTLVRHAPDRYEFHFPGGALLVAADEEGISHRRAARAVREVVNEIEGKIAADTPPRTISLDYDELSAEYDLPDGGSLFAFHRTFACAPLKCHFTLVQREDAQTADQSERLNNLPHDPKRKTRVQSSGGVVGAMTTAGARVQGPATVESEAQRRDNERSFGPSAR